MAVSKCRVKTVTSKNKTVVKMKLIDLRSLEEAAFLDNLASWLIHSGTTGREKVFSFLKADGGVSVGTKTFTNWRKHVGERTFPRPILAHIH